MHCPAFRKEGISTLPSVTTPSWIGRAVIGRPRNNCREEEGGGRRLVVTIVHIVSAVSP